MKTKTYLVFLVLFLLASFVFCQNVSQTDSVSDSNLVIYSDSLRGFEVKVPDWLLLRDTGSSEAWGGTLPAIDGVENAIIIRTILKSEYDSLENLINDKVLKYHTGEKIENNPNMIFMIRKKLEDENRMDSAYHVQFLGNGHMYTCQYVFLETENRYIWINFTATQDTYKINLSKFESFLKGFKIIRHL